MPQYWMREFPESVWIKIYYSSISHFLIFQSLHGSIEFIQLETELCLKCLSSLKLHPDIIHFLSSVKFVTQRLDNCSLSLMFHFF